MIRALAVLSLMFVLSIPARADTLAPCSPSCTFTDPFRLFDISIPSTAFTVWDGPIEELPHDTFAFGLFSTPARDDLTIWSFLSEAYAFSDSDISGPIRYARRRAAQDWAKFENGESGWGKDPDGKLFFSDPAADPHISGNPEPSTWLLMVTGVIGLIIFAARRQRLSTITSSQ